MNRKKVCVLIPAFQEERSIGSIVQEVKSRGFPVVVINDCSADDTNKKARSAGAVVIDLPVNSGYGVALQTGYKYAWRKGYEYVIQMDADGQHDPEDMEKLLIPVCDGECDLTIGSRFLSENSYKVPLSRRMGMILFASILNIATSRKHTDPTSGYQAFNRKVLRLFISEAFPRDFPDADLLLMVHKAGLQVKEISVAMKENTTGKSMHSGIIGPLYYIFRMLLGMMVTMLRDPSREVMLSLETNKKGDES